MVTERAVASGVLPWILFFRGGSTCFAEVQGVEALGNFANGNVDDGLDGRGIDNRDGAGAGVGNVNARAVWV